MHCEVAAWHINSPMPGGLGVAPAATMLYQLFACCHMTNLPDEAAVPLMVALPSLPYLQAASTWLLT
jgi:hypothetical protein